MCYINYVYVYIIIYITFNYNSLFYLHRQVLLHKFLLINIKVV